MTFSFTLIKLKKSFTFIFIVT